MTFRATLDEHLQAIRDRDLPALLATLPADRLNLIMADGRRITTVAEFAALHRDWFASPTWTLGTELVDLIETADLGVAVLRLDYRDDPPGADPIRAVSLLTLIFARQGDRWVMVLDQNTPIKAPG
jgi:ketosteroid isomerase-like protein